MQLAFEFKDDNKCYTGRILQPKDANPSQDFYQLWTAPLPRLKNTEATTGHLKLDGPWVAARRDFEAEMDIDPSHLSLDAELQVFATRLQYLLCSQMEKKVLCKGNSGKESRNLVQPGGDGAERSWSLPLSGWNGDLFSK